MLFVHELLFYAVICDVSNLDQENIKKLLCFSDL